MFATKLSTALSFAAATLLAGASHADMIGWNVTAGAGYMPGFGEDTLAPGDTAGASGFEQSNWNNHALSTQSPGSTPLVLNDETGTATAVSITGWELIGTTGNAWGYGDTSTPDAKMHNTYTSGGHDDSIELTYTGLNTFAPLGYTAVVYYGSSNSAGQSANITVNGTDIGVFSSDSVGSVGYIEFDDAETASNYAVFSGLTSDNLVISADTNDFGVSGVQIVAVPEPGSLALLGLGGLAIATRRRR